LIHDIPESANKEDRHLVRIVWFNVPEATVMSKRRPKRHKQETSSPENYYYIIIVF